MANTDLIIPVVVAVIGLLGSVISLFLGWRSQKRAQVMSLDLESHKNDMSEKLEQHKINIEHGQTVSVLREKYSQPLLVAAYDLQQRLYELVEFPISRQHLSKPDGLEDLKIFTCYLLGQYLAYTYILRTKTGYLSFTRDDKLAKLRKLMYVIDEELDRRRGADGHNVGVWPAARILVCERMLSKGDSLNDALDGGFGVEVKGFDQFQKDWPEGFRQPMGYFCEWIDLMLEGRLHRKPGNEAAMRCLQHLLVDLVHELDRNNAYIPQYKGHASLKCERSVIGCDCDAEECRMRRKENDLDEVLRERQKSRLNDHGIWSYNGPNIDRREQSHRTPNNQIDLQMVKKMTCSVELSLDN